MTDQIHWQDGDGISPDNLSQLRAQTNSSDYVERGLSFTPDYANNELDIATGHAVIYDESNDRAYDVFPDARTNLALTDAATNYVYLMCDPDNVTGSGVDDDVGYHIDTDDTPPTATETSATTISLKVGEVDTSADTTVELQRAPSIDVEKATITRGDVGDLYLTGATPASQGMRTTQTETPLFAEYLEANILTGYDPDIYHKSHFDDGLYRVTITDSANSNTDLYTCSDPRDGATYTKVADNILSSGAVNRRVNDHAVLGDGRFAVYVTDDDVAQTDVWVGESLTTLSRVGKVMDAQDGGAIRAPDGTIHHYPENPNDTADQFSSYSISHYTTPEDDLTNATLQQSKALDIAGYGWSTGDAEVINLGGTYYMFLDRKAGGGDYTIAVARSDDLANWTLVTDQLTPELGGDITVAKFGGTLVGLTEQSEGTQDDISTWELTHYSPTPQWQARERGVAWQFAADTIDGFTTGVSGSGTAASLNAGASRVELSTGTTSGSKSNLVKWLLSGFGAGNAAGNTMSWAVDRTLTADVEFLDVNGEAFVVTGAADTGALTLRHVGIGATGGDIIGSVGDGTAQTTTTLITGAATGTRTLRIELAANEKAEFYVDGRKRGEITTGLPSGATNADRPLMAFVANSTATDRDLHLYRARFAQARDSRRN